LLSKNHRHVSKNRLPYDVSCIIDVSVILYRYCMTLQWDILSKNLLTKELRESATCMADYVRKIQTISAYILTRTE